LTALSFGEVMVRRGSDEQFFAIGGGFAEVQPAGVIVLADSAERAEEIDLERAERARSRAEEAMKDGGTPEEAARYAQIEAALKRAQIRIDVSRRRTRRRRRTGLAQIGASQEEDRS
jgi:F-type H+-transporting ATPase subunit epsilon